MAPALPEGTVTFLFTDIEGSTRLWDEYPVEMRQALLQHDDLLRAAIESHDGRVFKTVGDAFCAAFEDPAGAVRAVLACQVWLPALALSAADGPHPLKVRMALHSGVAETRDADYFGPALNRIARLLTTAHGGQVLLSGAACDLLGDRLPPDTTLLDRGSHRLKDLQQPERVFQLRHPDLPLEFPPLRSLSTHPNNLPQQLTSFIGRERETAAVKQLLAGPSRLVTLIGTGGTGKTRLSLQSAADLLEVYPNGVWLIELASLSDPALVPQAAAGALGLHEEAGRPLIRTLVEHLEHRQLLLVLDNCEHLVAAAALLADTILRTCPQVRMLATSREALRIDGEVTYRVPSLSLPEGSHETAPESLLQFESTRLLIERASQVRPDFSLSSRNAPALVSICRRLDGIPLAIELAAARVRSLSVEEVDQRLDRRFQLLTGGSRTALPRQQTLRSLIDWSYDLLDEREKALFQRLSLFAGGWTANAAEQVCSGDAIDEWDVFDLLTSLADKSLVFTEDRDGATRYRFLETVRQFALEKATAVGADERWRDRHLTHFLSLAEEALPHLSDAQQAVWLERLEAEHDNLRAALEWSRATASGPEPGFRLVGALWRFWMMRGLLAEGRQHCTALFECYRDAPASGALGKALHAAGNLALIQADVARARELYERAVAIRREIGDAVGEAGTIGNLGTIAQREGEFDTARRWFEQSLALFENLDDRNGVAISVTCLGTLAQAQGDYPAAREALLRALALNRQIGNRAAEANVLNNLGCVERQTNNVEAAEDAFRQALAINRELGFAWETALNLINLSVYPRLSGEFEEARACLTEALQHLRDVGARDTIVECLYQCAEVERHLGRPDRSARLFGFVCATREDPNLRQSQEDADGAENLIAALRDTLGESALKRESEAGRDLTIEAAIELALQP
jgi:predicted ATPase/class 3 adenylate cyclase/Flp pilus assembly protein TadD